MLYSHGYWQLLMLVNPYPKFTEILNTSIRNNLVMITPSLRVSGKKLSESSLFHRFLEKETKGCWPFRCFGVPLWLVELLGLRNCYNLLRGQCGPHAWRVWPRPRGQEPKTWGMGFFRQLADIWSRYLSGHPDCREPHPVLLQCQSTAG